MSSKPSESWVLVKQFGSRLEAEIARDFLEKNHIRTRVYSDDVGGMHPELAASMGVRLFVLEKDQDVASKLLGE